MEIIIFLFRSTRYLLRKLIILKDKTITFCLFKLNRVRYKDFQTRGVPFIHVAGNSQFIAGTNLKINNTKMANPIGRESKCSFVVMKGGALIIGDNVGISSTSIVCHNKIKIEDNVKIGGNTCIYDTDFHSLSAENRIENHTDQLNTQTKPVHLKKNSFIGAHSTILKGVTIGENSILGAGSILTKSIPDNEIWAGNPAVFVRNINSWK